LAPEGLGRQAVIAAVENIFEQIAHFDDEDDFILDSIGRLPFFSFSLNMYF